ASDSTGYLIASSQGSDEFVVYRREGNNDYVMTFELVDGNGIDGVKGTDGIDVTNFELNATFASGLFIAQDDGNPGANQNFKLVRWEDIARAIAPPLTIDPTWDPRLVGLVSQSVELEGAGLQLGVQDGVVWLRWQTRREENHRGFFIERKLAGAGAFQLLAHFRDHPELAARASGAGDYQFQDRTARPGFTYVYRVWSVSADGSSQLVATRQIRVPPPASSSDNTMNGSIHLLPAFPNPFNPETHIQFALQRMGPVRLDVFNAAGQQVRTLFQGQPQALVMELTWDGKDGDGEPLPSGVYLVRLRQDNQVRVQKVLLLK
ncbi:MAG: phytase, partial [Calditrichaeota bacterium]